jgi:hypothetical protein
MVVGARDRLPRSSADLLHEPLEFGELGSIWLVAD